MWGRTEGCACAGKRTTEAQSRAKWLRASVLEVFRSGHLGVMDQRTQLA